MQMSLRCQWTILSDTYVFVYLLFLTNLLKKHLTVLQTAKGILNLPYKKTVKFRLAPVTVKPLKLAAMYFPEEDFHFIISHKIATESRQ